MSTNDENTLLARAIIDANLYMVLGTADQDGRPWVSPVYYAYSEYREFFWVSSPKARHSQNLLVRPDLAVVIFDSSAAIGTGQAVYMSAVGREVPAGESASGLAVYSQRSIAHGGYAWTATHITSPADLRLYQATAADHFILGESDERVRVSP